MTAPYHEGQFFLLPIERGHFAVGLIARAPARGGVLLGYFFGPRRSQAPGAQGLNALHPEQATLVCRFKDSALYRGEWQLLTPLEGFTRAAWPIPAFHRFDGSVTHVPGNDAVQDWKVEYGDDNLIVPLKESAAHGAELKLPQDLAYDAALLADTVAHLVKDMGPTADDATWR
jgi:immunity protein 26 of polymorphic toxin system